jgi:hypothetical protein
MCGEKVMTTYASVVKKGVIKAIVPLKKGLIGLAVLFMSVAFVLPEES